MAVEAMDIGDEETGVPPAFGALLLYEDCETGLRARQSLLALQKRGVVEEGSCIKLWRCDLLRATWLREQAAKEAAAMDLLILSLHKAEGVPTELRQFFSRWLALKKTGPCALGVLLDSSRGLQAHSTAFRSYLEQVAAAAGGHLVWGSGETPTPTPAGEHGFRGTPGIRRVSLGNTEPPSRWTWTPASGFDLDGRTPA